MTEETFDEDGITDIEIVKRDAAMDWLNHVSSIIATMRACEDVIREEKATYDMLGAVRYDREGGHATQVEGDDAIAAHVLRISDAVDRMDSMDAEYREAMRDAIDVFGRLTCHPCAKAVMIRRYLLREKWADIADKIGYSLRRTTYIAEIAAVECYGMMPVQWRIKLPSADDSR